jgi:hypothetical protein
MSGDMEASTMRLLSRAAADQARRSRAAGNIPRALRFAEGARIWRDRATAVARAGRVRAAVHLGPRVPADPQRAARNRRNLADLVRKHDPVLLEAHARVLEEVKRPVRAAARVRSR